jgi:hypothetical protein
MSSSDDYDDYVDDRLHRHRKDINKLFDKSKCTDSRLKSINSQLHSLQATANGRANAASEAVYGRIQVIEETVKKGEGIADTMNVHIYQVNSRLRVLADEAEAHRRENIELRSLVKDLTTRLEQLEAVPTRRCTSCSIVIRPAKPTHLKCDNCYSSSKERTCTKCTETFYPVHYSYKICPSCYLKKKAKKSQKI